MRLNISHVFRQVSYFLIVIGFRVSIIKLRIFLASQSSALPLFTPDSGGEEGKQVFFWSIFVLASGTKSPLMLNIFVMKAWAGLQNCSCAPGLLQMFVDPDFSVRILASNGILVSAYKTKLLKLTLLLFSGYRNFYCSTAFFPMLNDRNAFLNN